MILWLDTNAYCDWQKTGRWNDKIKYARRIGLSSIVLGELWGGFYGGRSLEKNSAQLYRFLAEDLVTIELPGETTAKIYGQFCQQLRQQRTPIPTNDIWIAALAFEHGGQLATSDKHFRHLPQVALAVES